MRFLFYSHDGLGLGHTRRNVTIATALAKLSPNASILLATGADYVRRLGLPPQVDILKLPGLRKISNGNYVSRHLRLPVAEVRTLRSELLLAAIKSYSPSVVLVDKHPFGASGEFKAGLEALGKLGGKTVLGLRDILDVPERVLQEWQRYQLQQRIADFYDEVLVYGHRTVFDPVLAYQFPERLAQHTHFCGYVANDERPEDLSDYKWPFPPREDRVQPVVLATVGGGEDGFALLETFVRATAGAPWQGVAVTGPMAPEAEFTALKRLAAKYNVTLRNFIPYLPGLFWSLDAVVCMGGYNTLVETASKGVPTVCVPRVAPRSEQLLRAKAFEDLGLLRLLRPDELSADRLRRELDVVLRVSRQELLSRAQQELKFDGAHQAASRLLGLASQSCQSPSFPTNRVAA